jgi:hypothetical protein
MSDVRIENEPKSFFDLYGSGNVASEAIDDWVGRWHDGSAAGQELHIYLGLTLPDYQVWVYDPEALPVVLHARQTGTPLVEAVRIHLAALARAGSTTDRKVIRGLQTWLDVSDKTNPSAA